MSENFSLYSLAGYGSSLFIYLIEQRQADFFLCRIDLVDRIVASEDLCASMQEALLQAKRETGQELKWKNMPSRADPVQYIFDHEPRLNVKLNLKPEKAKTGLSVAIYLVWADFAITSLISLAHYFAVSSRMPEAFEIITPGSASLLFFLLNLAFTLTMSLKLSQGVKWARTTYMISCAITLFTIAFKPGQSFSHGLIIGLLTAVQAVYEMAALYYLYTGESARKFRKKK